MELAYGHVMPQAIEIEKAVLGALMIDKDAYLEVCDLLRPESFYEPRNQKVYEAIQKLSIEQDPVDVLTVTDKLEKMGELDEVGGPTYIADLSSRVATSANIEYHAKVVAEKFLARQMVSYVSVIGKDGLRAVTGKEHCHRPEDTHGVLLAGNDRCAVG